MERCRRKETQNKKLGGSEGRTINIKAKRKNSKERKWCRREKRTTRIKQGR
jgi:hypothetical protein